MQHSIHLGGLELCLHPSGVLYEPAHRLLVVADLHLETGSAHARRGRLLPPYDTMATLQRLDAVLRHVDPAMVVSLGDGFHDRHGGDCLSPAAFDGLAAIMHGRRWVWITGNHDPAPPLQLGGAVCDALELGGVVLRHVPQAGAACEIAGHMHPKARVARRPSRPARPCFLTSRARVVMPAFGALTGGLNAIDGAFEPLFPDGFEAWLLGERRVFRFPRHALAPEPSIYPTIRRGLVGVG